MDESIKHANGECDLRIRLLGGFQVAVGPRKVGEAEWKLRKAKSLVKLLALAPGHRLHREQVMDIVWPDLDPQAASNNLRKALHVVRRALGPSALLSHEDLLVLGAQESMWVDVDAFDAAAGASRRTGNLESYREALALYKGDLLPEDLYEEWTVRRREELRGAHLSLLVEAARLYEARGELQVAVEVLQQAIEAEPLLEEAHQALVRLYAASGQRHQAIRQYRQLSEALKRELDAEPHADTQQLYQEIVAGRFPKDEGRRTKDEDQPARKHNLPAQLTSFIGREREIDEVKRLLSGTRLLTLTGPGGSGKTRMALEVAATLVDEYPDGVWLVELAALFDPEVVPTAVASAVGVREESGQTLDDTLAASLRSKKLLLVLDNCEHLVATCAQLVEALLRACPKLRVLATSREALGVPGETTWLVPTLSLPDPAHLPSPDADLADALMQYEAIRLFVDRATAARQGLRLSDHNAQAIAQICHRLDGIPLAIELAAARVRVLAVEQIAERLDHSFHLLTSGSRTALPRHQTLNAAIEWSYNLLSDEERTLFRRLSVFAGEFRLEAAEAVCGASGIGNFDFALEAKLSPQSAIRNPQSNVLDVLSHLVDKSLVVVLEDARGEEARYRLLETVRQYAEDKLAESGEDEEARRRHAMYYVALAEWVGPLLRGLERKDLLKLVNREHENLRAALVWYEEHDPRSLVRLTGNLQRYWYAYNYLNEGRAWVEKALSHADSGEHRIGLARTLTGTGMFAWLQGDNAVARSRLEESVAILRELDDKHDLATALHFLGHATLDLGDHTWARTYFEESLELYREVADARLSQTLIGDLGLVAYHQGDYSAARTFFEEGLARLREIKVTDSMTDMLNRLGDLARIEGDYERAAELYEESLVLSRETHDDLAIASALHKLGHLARHRGGNVEAGALFVESLALQRRLGNKQGLIECIGGVAGVLADQSERPESIRRAAMLFGAVESLLATVKVPLAPADRNDYERDVASVRAHMDETSFDAAWAEGQALTLESAINLALEAGREV
jgi:predicted ATPase/DNA-binding SARP family transcriptional activator